MKPFRDQQGEYWIERKAAARALGVTDLALAKLGPRQRRERIDGHLRTLVNTKDLRRDTKKA